MRPRPCAGTAIRLGDRFRARDRRRRFNRPPPIAHEDVRDARIPQDPCEPFGPLPARVRKTIVALAELPLGMPDQDDGLLRQSRRGSRRQQRQGCGRADHLNHSLTFSCSDASSSPARIAVTATYPSATAARSDPGGPPPPSLNTFQ